MRGLLSLVSAGCAFLLWTQTQPRTLRDLLTADGMIASGGALPNLDKRITSGDSSGDSARYVAAYYLDNGTGTLSKQLFVDFYDRNSRTWTSATLTGAGFQVNAMGRLMAGDICLGSVSGIHTSAESIFLDTHITPSAGCLLILSPDLKVRAALFGWYLGRFNDDSVVYERGEVQFAPVHPAELALYNWRTGREVEIFPRRPFQAVRLAQIQRLRDFYSTRQEWCRKNNDPCDPEQMDSSLLGDVAINDSEHALAFRISYNQIQATQDEQKPSGPGSVVYVIRHADDPARIEYREFLSSDADLSNFLESDRLDQLFRR